jgi:hypothetical protein
VTPFDSWYSATIAPTLPNDMPDVLKKAARESMAACWNAALDEVERQSRIINGEEYCLKVFPPLRVTQ